MRADVDTTRPLAAPHGPAHRRGWDTAARIAAITLLLFAAVRAQTVQMADPGDTGTGATHQAAAGATAAPREAGVRKSREVLLSGYVAQPYYYRSDVHLTHRDGTDITLKRLGWDGDMLMPPIDGGIRSMEWWGPFGFMIDFLHNKAVARLGTGAHGRKIASPVIETVDAEGKLKGEPAPDRIKLTDLFNRLEFTHGHNVLLFTPMVSALSFLPGVRPYIGVGAGFALPHVEVWFADGAPRTNEYQYAGPAAQLVVGLDIRRGKGSIFLEYKFSFAWIAGALTGDQSWKNFNMPGDLLRQFLRWWRNEEPKFGHFQTRLGAHQVAIGAGYWWQMRKGDVQR